MAMHFARSTIGLNHSISSRLSGTIYNQARSLPPYQRARYVASRSLLAELLFMLYGIKHLPNIERSSFGRPQFSDSTLPDFSIAYAGNMVGVLLTPEGRCGLDIDLQHRFITSSPEAIGFISGNEIIWANNQLDPNEAYSQLSTLRQSILKLIGIPKTPLQLFPLSGRFKVDRGPYIETISDIEETLVWGCAATLGIVGLHLWSYSKEQGWQRLKDLQTRYQNPHSRMMRLISMYGENGNALP